MGLSGISMSELLIILLIVVLLFGTKHLKTLGSDLGGAIRGFRSAMQGKEPEEPAPEPAISAQRAETTASSAARTTEER